MVEVYLYSMPTAEWMIDEVKKVYPDADVEVFDTTGSGGFPVKHLFSNNYKKGVEECAKDA